jgi:hypothetical protein
MIEFHLEHKRQDWQDLIDWWGRTVGMARARRALEGSTNIIRSLWVHARSRPDDVVDDEDEDEVEATSEAGRRATLPPL